MVIGLVWDAFTKDRQEKVLRANGQNGRKFFR